MNVSLARSDDYLRAFHHLRYEVRQPMRWQRLAFYQLGADFYNSVPARWVAIGDAAGLREEWRPKLGRGLWDRRGTALSGPQPWISVHGVDKSVLHEGDAAASRGLIVRSWKAVLDGKPSPLPYVSTYATESWKGESRIVVELSPPPAIATLKQGDYIEADLELVVFPAEASSYYGPNEAFRKNLEAAADSWQLTSHEAAGNHLRVKAQRGQVLQPYPLRVSVAAQQARVSVMGGLGYVPVTFTGLDHYWGYQLAVDGAPLDQSVHGNDFWQTDYDALAKTWRMTFNVLLNDGSHDLRFTKLPMPETARSQNFSR